MYLKFVRIQAKSFPTCCILVFGVALAWQAGCGSVAVESDTSASNATIVIDGGIVFADEASYMCVPLSRMGIGELDEVLSVKSSCECADPTIVRFEEASRNVARALHLKFAPELAMLNAGVAPSNLGVVIKLELSSGRTASATIQFLHTKQVKQEH